MRTGTVSYRLEDLKNGVIIPIGFVGENDFTKVFFDAEEIYKKFPNASVSMKVQPPKGVIYPAAVTRDGNTVIWQVKEADVANRGGGELQLTFIDGETKIKTYIAKTDVKRSLAGNGPAPDPVQDFVDNANEKLAEVDDALEDLEAMDTIAKNALEGDIGKALSPKTVENGVVTEWQYVEPGAGTEDYTDLENKPSIGGVTLAGDKSLHDLGIAAESAIPDVSGKANLSVVAPAFDQATANDAGSLVTYTDGVVYVLPEGHTAGTTWANTQKTATNIAEQQRLLLNDIQGLENDTDTIKETLGLDGTVVDYGTGFPLAITAEEGTVVHLTFDTAQSYYVANKNLFGEEDVSFTNNKKVTLPFRLPAGTYTLSSLVTTTDTDVTYSVFIIYDGSSAIASYYLERDVRKSKTFTTSVPFDSILFYASDDWSHSQNDTATWASVQLEANGSPTGYVAPIGYVETVGESNTITIETSPTYIYTDDFSDATGYGTSGEGPVITQMQSEIAGHEKFITDNDFDGNKGDKYNVLKVPYELSDFADNSFIGSDGSILTGTSYEVFMVSPLIEVKKPGLYGIKVSKENSNVGNIINSVNGFCFYGQNGTTAIARTENDLSNISGNIYTLNVPEGTYYVRFTVYKVSSTTQERTLTQFNQWILLPDANDSINDGFFVLSTPKDTGHADRILRSDGSCVKLCSTELLNKKILVFGDSIWGNDRTNGVCDFLNEYCGATIYNCAIGGTWICGDRANNQGAPSWKAFDGVNLIDAKLTDTWTDQDTYKDSVTSYAPEVITLLKSVDMSKIDIVILSYGTNDFSNDKTIAAIKSAYETVIEEILTLYPKIRILICTPAWRMFSGTDGDTYENGNGDTIKDMNDGIVEMAIANHVAVLNMLEVLPWRALTKAYYLDSDEVHPNTEGNKVYAHVVHGKLRSMY